MKKENKGAMMVLDELLIVLKKLKKRLDCFKTITGNILIHHTDIKAVFDLGSFFKSREGFGYDIDLCLQYRGVEFKETVGFVSSGVHVVVNQREAFEYCKKNLCRSVILSYQDLNKKLKETYGPNSFIFTDALVKSIRVSIDKKLTWGHFISQLERSVSIHFKQHGYEKRVFKFYWHNKAKARIKKLLQLKDMEYTWNIQVSEWIIGDYFLIDASYYGKLGKFIERVESRLKKIKEIRPC